MTCSQMLRIHQFIFIVICCGQLLACAHSPQYSESTSTASSTSTEISGEETSKGKIIAALAHSLLGSPYKYGGATPKGFDCSGLVLYTHKKVGIATPRTSLQQYKTAKGVKLSELISGDLVFFKLSTSKVSHVGIYVGNGQFIHAPKRGKRVAVNQLNDLFWKPRIVGAGRLY